MAGKELRALISIVVAGLMIALSVACSDTSEAQLIASARSQLDKRDVPSAIIQLKSALSKNPQSANARYWLGMALLQGGTPIAAVVEFEKALELKLSEDEVIPKLAQAMLQAGQIDKAIERFSLKSLADPKAAASLKSSLAAAYSSQGKLDQASSAVESAMALDSANLPARLLQARLTASRGTLDEAMVLANKIVIEEPKSHEARQLLGELIWARDGNLGAAIDAFRVALILEPRSLPTHSALISALVKKGDLVAVRQQIEVAKRQVPGRLEINFYEVQVSLLANDRKAAREGVQQLLRAAPDSPAALQLAGAVELQSGSLVRAETFLTKALQIAPQLKQARRLLAQVNIRAGRPVQALAVLQPLIESNRPQAEELAMAAEANLLIGNAAKAEELFTRASKASPEDTKIRAAIAVSKVLKGDDTAGMAQLESLAASDKSVSGDMALISARLRRGELDAALRAVLRLEAKTPDRPIPHQLRGQILTQRKDFLGARKSFEKALTFDNSYFPAINSLAGLDIAEKNPESAKSRYQAVLTREPDNSWAMLAIARILQASGAKPDETVALLRRSMKVNPSDDAPRLQLIDLYLSLREFKLARDAAQEAIAAIPDSIALLDALGRAQLASGDTKQAIDTFRRLATAQPNTPLSHLRLADAYAAAKDPAATEQSLRRALDLAPKLLVAQRGLVQLAVADKRFGDATKIAQTVQRERPNDSIGWLLEADVQVGQKRVEAATVALRSALERSKDSQTAKRLHASYVLTDRWPDAERFAAKWTTDYPRDVQFLHYLGAIAVDRKEYAKAEATFLQVLKLKEDDPMALNNLAWSLLQQGKPGAMPLAERANKLLPDRPEVMETLSVALAAENQPGKALEWQRKAVAKAPNDPKYRLQLARLLLKSGSRDEARAELEKLAYLGQKFDGQAEVAKLLASP